MHACSVNQVDSEAPERLRLKINCIEEARLCAAMASDVMNVRSSPS